MAKFYAFYLPQYHPIPENDEWYGKGFTEWRSVASARPLYPGHYEPHIPADLGFYDLRLKETVLAQVEMAKEYGVDGFLYWHYWFGHGKQLLEGPFNEMVRDKSIDFHFAAAWANETWVKKLWGAEGQNRLLIEQEYPGEEDYVAHFYSLLEAFRDNRYIRVDGRLLFIIYKPMKNPGIADMMRIWKELAQKEGLGDFYFVADDSCAQHREELMAFGYDAIYNNNTFRIYLRRPLALRTITIVSRWILHIPEVVPYRKAAEYMIMDEDSEEDVIPVVTPNWDHSPRSGSKTIMYRDCEPRYFKQVVKRAIQAIKGKSPEKQLVFIKSWNEWGEGNHMEPDVKYGRGYLEALKAAREEENV